MALAGARVQQHILMLDDHEEKKKHDYSRKIDTFIVPELNCESENNLQCNRIMRSLLSDGFL